MDLLMNKNVQWKSLIIILDIQSKSAHFVLKRYSTAFNLHYQSS